MKVLQVNKYYHLNGGADRVFFNTMSLLSSHGHEVAPFCTLHPDNLDSPFDKYFVDAPEIRNLGTIGKIKAMPRFFWSRHAARQLERLIADFKPDVAHLHNIFNGLSVAILPILHKHRIPVVMTVHEPRFVCPASAWNMRGKLCEKCRSGFYTNCLTHRCCKQSLVLSIMGMLEMIHKDFIVNAYTYIDRYIFLNTTFRDVMSREHPLMRQRAEVLPNFIPDLSTHSPSRGAYFLLYGRLTAEKGIGTFLEMAAQVPEAKFVVAGKGDMEAAIRDAGLPNVEIRGFLSGESLERAIADSAYVLVPSEWMENNPMTIIEAYSYGKPVIATTLGGIPDMVTEGNTGWLIPPFDPGAFASAVREALKTDGDAYSTMVRNAVEFAKRTFDREAHYKCLLQIYDNAADDLKNRTH